MSVSSANTAYAQNFQISPASGYAFPTVIYPGQTVSAYYAITNRTHSTRNGYHIEGLPWTVKQNSSSTTTCPDTITLAAGESCILRLDIIGEALSSFILCSGSSCTTAFPPLNVVKAVTPLPKIEVAAGTYFDAFGSYYPLLATSTDGGRSWSYTVSTQALPGNCTVGEGLTYASFASTSCSGANCIAAGSCSTASGTTPLLATSTNAGGAWSYTIGSAPALPSACVAGGEGAHDASFASTSCSGANCIAAGSCSTASGNTPLLASSTNGGGVWSYTIGGSTPALPNVCANGGFFTSASCSGANCIAAGSCNTALNTMPLVATSTNGGGAWSYTIGSTPALPSGCAVGEGGGGRFVSASCNGANCIAAGSCNTSLGTIPLLATSTNSGGDWSYTIGGSTPALPGSCAVGEGSFVSASCSGANCIAAGSCSSAAGNMPLLATSTNGGGTWSYTIGGSTPALPSSCVADGEGAISASFTSASCSGANCIAAGSCSAASGNTPLLATSTDGGGAWSYTIGGSTPALPGSCVTGGDFNSASCSGLDCIAVGSCSNAAYNSFPLAATSTDGGITWSYTIDSSTPALPANATGGSFSATTSVAGTTSSLLPKSLQFLNH
ncbi:MAG: hypothetical protein ACHP65_03350 [Legionellales bacterium]